MKYIIYSVNGKEEVDIFSEQIEHRLKASSITAYFDLYARNKGKVDFVSAGHFHLLDGTVFATGESMTLGLKSKLEDAEFIKNRLAV